MRIYEGNYAYEIEAAVDPVTRVGAGWRYNIYRVRPQDQLLSSGTAPSREAAEKAGVQALQELQTTDERKSAA